MSKRWQYRSIGEQTLLNMLFKSMHLEQGISASLSPGGSSRSQSCAYVCEKQRHIAAAWDEKGIFHSYTCQQEWHWHLALLWCLSAQYIKELCKDKISWWGLYWEKETGWQVNIMQTHALPKHSWLGVRGGCLHCKLGVFLFMYLLKDFFKFKVACFFFLFLFFLTDQKISA